MTVGHTNWTRVVFGLCLAFLAAYQLFKLPPVLPVLLETFRYDRVMAGGFMSVYAIAGLGLSVLLARTLERQGAGRPVLAALALMVAGNLLVLIWPGHGFLVLGARALEGVAFAVLAIAGPTLANTGASQRHLPLVIGLTATWIPVGQLSASLIASLIVPTGATFQAWRTLWIVAVVLSILMGFWTVRLHRSGRVQFGSGLPSGATPAAIRPLSRRARTDLLLAAMIFMLWSSQYFAYMTWLPQYLVEVHGLPVTWALAGYMLPVAVLMLFNVITGGLLRAGVPLGPLMAAALALQAAVWGLHPALGGGWVGVALLVAYGVGAGITPTCLFALPSTIAGAARAATAFGVLMTGRNIGVLVGPVLLAQAFKLAGSWEVSAPIFGSLTGLAVAIGLLLALRLPRS
ncbi:MAG: MFS transporter [Rhodospirillales bacterium]|nr:MFS transporter [Rhodospirillales bacterium]MDH3917026.1 MFS transporter [Rhodospirillales bacterium]